HHGRRQRCGAATVGESRRRMLADLRAALDPPAPAVLLCRPASRTRRVRPRRGVRRSAALRRRRRARGPPAGPNPPVTTARHARAPRRPNVDCAPRGCRRQSRAAPRVRRPVAPVAIRPARGESHLRHGPADARSRADGTDRGLVCVLPEPGRDQRGDSGGRAAVRRENGVTLPVLGRVAQRAWALAGRVEPWLVDALGGANWAILRWLHQWTLL